MYQPVTVTKGSTYTLSGYVKTSGISTVNGKGAWLYASYYDGSGNNIQSTTETMNDTNNVWQRLEVTFTVPANSTSNVVNIAAGIVDESGIAYFDAIQLEESSVANRYNLAENADFSNGLNYWNLGNTNTSDVLATNSDSIAKGLDSNVMKLTGETDKNKRIYQEVKVNGNAGDIFTFGGWAKGQSVPLQGDTRWFAVDLQFNYSDGSQSWNVYNFNEDSSQWQYITKRAVADKAYNSVTAIFRYYGNQNEAFFDSYQLYKEEFGKSYSYDSNGNLISTADLNNKNSTFEYDPAKNDLIKAIDPKGGIFRYTYDDKHNLKTATTAESVNYSFNYNSKGNPIDGAVGVNEANKYSDANNYNSGNRFFPIDIDGDKKDELLSRDTDGNLTILKSTGEKLSDYVRINGTELEDSKGIANGNYFFVADINGDEKEDLLVRFPDGRFEIWQSNGVTIEKTTSFTISDLTDANGYGTGNRFFIMDVNGDKKDEIVVRNAYGDLSIYSYNGTNYTNTSTTNISLLTDANNFNTGNRFFVTDINGDLKDDLLVRGGSGTFIVYQFTGTGFVETNRSLISDLSDANGWNTGLRFVMLDMDGDGKKELLARNSLGSFKIYKTNGTNIEYSGLPDYNTAYQDSVGWNDGIRYFPMDIDGDLKDDFLARKAIGDFEYNKSTGTGFQKTSDTSIFIPSYLTASANYTASGQYISELKDTFGNTVKYEYNESLDQLTKSIDPKNNATNYTYDSIGRLKKSEKTLSDQSKISVENAYTSDRLTSLTKNGYSYNYNYDPIGNLVGTSVSNENGTISLSANNYEKVIGGDGRQYDTGALLSTTYNNGGIIGFAYDSLYRVTAKSYNNEEKFSYQYDNTGNLAYKKDLVNNIDFRYIYDLANRLVQVKDITNKNSIKYEYDDNNNINKVSEALAGISYDTTYTYDKDNKQKTIVYNDAADSDNNYTKSYNYDILGRLTNTQLRTASEYSYNTGFIYVLRSDGSTTSTKIKEMNNNGKVIAYSYDNYGNIETVTSSGKEIKYTYNELNELVREDNQVLNKTIVYEYDLAGNIQSKSEYAYTTLANPGTAISIISYSYADTVWKDKLTSYAAKAITYDEIGNTKTYDGNTFTWEAGSQLSGITGNGKTSSYKYNDSGIRTEKTYNGVTTTYILEGDHVISEKTGEGSSIHYTYSRAGSLISMNYEGVEYYYIKNAQGDIIGLYDTTGNEVVTYTYDTWGKLISIDGTMKDTLGLNNPYRYRGYRYDTETGLYYLQSRYYNPEWGRFINADAIVTGNEFAYCGNDPVNYVDPTGFKAIYGQDADGNDIAQITPDGPISNDVTGEVYDSKSGITPGKVIKEVATNTGDAIIGAAIVEKLEISKKSTTQIRSLGAGMEVETITYRSGIKSLKGASKVTGALALASYGYDLYLDSKNYEGNNRIGAMALTTGGFVATCLIGAGLTIAGAPVLLAIGVGTGTGLLIGLGVDAAKDMMFDKKKR